MNRIFETEISNLPKHLNELKLIMPGSAMVRVTVEEIISEKVPKGRNLELLNKIVDDCKNIVLPHGFNIDKISNEINL